MTRFAGVKHNHICIVSNNSFTNDELQIIEIPSELSHISNSEIITNSFVKDGIIKYKFAKKAAKNMKIALVSNFGTKCGIGTYSKFLYEKLINYVGDYRIFSEKQDYKTEISIIPDEKVISCWQRGESLQNLIKEIKDYDPDIILIQHEFGLWSNARYWLAMLTQLSDYRIIVTMHSVFHHQDKTIVEAAIPEIIVHLDGAQNILKKEKKISGKVSIISHGCYPIIIQDKLWNMYKSNHTFIQQGFGFEYKNFEASIEAAAILKEKYPDIFFTALFSESQYNMVGHTIYYNKLMNLIEKFSLQENVAIIRGYQSDNVIDSYLRTNQVGVFPYISIPGHEVFGASGSARLAMAAGLPIITSNIPHFSDLPTIKADTAEQIAQELDKLFSNDKLKQQQIKIQNQFIIDNSWENIAKKYIEIFEN